MGFFNEAPPQTFLQAEDNVAVDWLVDWLHIAALVFAHVFVWAAVVFKYVRSRLRRRVSATCHLSSVNPARWPRRECKHRTTEQDLVGTTSAVALLLAFPAHFSDFQQAKFLPCKIRRPPIPKDRRKWRGGISRYYNSRCLETTWMGKHQSSQAHIVADSSQSPHVLLSDQT